MHAPMSSRRYRTLFLSDLHLGMRGARAERVLDFLRHHEADRWVLVGDVVDGWALARGWHWPQAHNDVIQKLLRKVRGGAEMVYVPGNHDGAARQFAGLTFGGILVLREHVHTTADGRRLLVLHGDEFDGVVRLAPWLSRLGARAYEAALKANAAVAAVRQRLGYPYWSLAAFLKERTKRAVQYMAEFEGAVARRAAEEGVDGVICGHIHRPELRTFASGGRRVLYANCGDWVESCTALAERHDGTLELIRWDGAERRQRRRPRLRRGPGPRASGDVSGARSLTVLFAVQGEGRGHMTQALALAPMLRRAGHTVCGALVGTGERQRLPAFFRDGLGVPVEPLAAPTFVAGHGGRIRLGATVGRAVRRWRETSASLDAMADALDRYEPDVVVSFFDGLTGLYNLLRPADAPVVAVGHQFMFEHPGYPFAPGQRVQRTAMQAYTRLVGASAEARLALSFYPAPEASGGSPAGVEVVPPLLRTEVLGMRGEADDGSLLVYLMDPAMGAALEAWSARRPEVEVHCFSAEPARRPSGRLTFHALCGSAFLARMATCRGVVCTAGFESVSEAMWLGKPVCMVPTPGHYEQRCNALDAAASGAGIAADDLARGLDAFLEFLPSHRADPEPFRAWVRSAEGWVVGAVERVAALAALPAPSGDGAVGAPASGVAPSRPSVRGGSGRRTSTPGS